jgi:hypothetical protein
MEKQERKAWIWRILKIILWMGTGIVFFKGLLQETARRD